MKRFVIFLFIMIYGIENNAQRLGIPISTYYSSQAYNGGIQNYAIAQNSEGLIYVANNFGLLEYDGVNWRRYALPSGSKMRHVQIAENGNIYVAGQGDFGYFSPDKIGRLQFTSMKPLIPEAFQNLEEVWKVFISNSGLYFCTSNRIYLFNSDHTYLEEISTKSSFESFHYHQGQIFVNELGKGLSRIEKTHLESLGSIDHFEQSQISAVLQMSPTNQTIFSKNHGIHSIQRGQIEPWKSVSADNINVAIQLKNGNVAIGTQDQGLMIITNSGESIFTYNQQNGLNNNTILSLFEDLSGNLWIGHNNGISVIDLNAQFLQVNQSSGLYGIGYHAAYYQGNIYFGTSNGVYVMNDANKTNQKAVLVRNSYGQVYQIKPFNNFLLVAHHDGAFVLKDNKAEKIPGPSGLWNFQTLKNNPNLLLVGGYNGIYLYIIENDKIEFLRQIKGFYESSRIIEQDLEGNIWVAHGYKGLYKLTLDASLENASVEVFGPESGLPSNVLNNVWSIKNELVFTTQAGIFKYDKITNRFEVDDYFLKYFKRDEILHFLLEDQLGNIYYISENNAGVLEKKVDGTFQKHQEDFNQIRKLLNDDLQNIASIKSNEVLFAANDGFIRFNLNDKKTKTNLYPTLIRSVYITGTTDSLIHDGNSKSRDSSMLKIPYKKSNLRFEASNPTPANEQYLSFQYWLEGFEEEYGEWVFKNEKAYTNLREGKYTFHVRSKDQNGILATPTSWSFEILPPWYRSGIAYFCYVIIFGFAAFAFYRTIDKKYQKKTQKIKTASQQVIDEKDSELQHSLQEVEKLRNENLLQEIQLKDKELATATMHLITKNGFIDHLKTNLGGIIKKSKNQEVKNEIQKVIKNIEKNIAEDEDWEQFEIHFDQVHGDFMSRFKKVYPTLSPQEIKLSAYLRMNLSTKEIAYLMNISVRGVEIARYRLRKKLELVREENLQEFILKF
ncbi:triple tyrosine motif-containing protein [Belliella kenyensis]|uniref:Triple tyrosine motif-containing protein n=1 Tax=Belliella kenyensis TaxID=1472724 RepID=A0ABV8EGW4_9BACT|nr:triple tyrosine motif-containing protein [Belliella kenyensis]MCH7400921.1 regulator [Belliella kenyensis]MDN3603920.1 triple tyrosine motif-containing protein [Belliella kenyensis]